MKYFISIILVCATLPSMAQTNFVKNGDFERYDTCPTQWGQLNLAKSWRLAVDSLFMSADYYNVCANVEWDPICHVPANTSFYQYPHSGNGLIGLHFYYGKTSPPYRISI